MMEMKSEICGLFVWSRGFHGDKTLESVTDGLEVMAIFIKMLAIAPPSGQSGQNIMRCCSTLYAVVLFPQSSNSLRLKVGSARSVLEQNKNKNPYNPFSPSGLNP